MNNWKSLEKVYLEVTRLDQVYYDWNSNLQPKRGGNKEKS